MAKQSFILREKSILPIFSPEHFVERQVKRLSETIGDKRALVAISGGVDSTTCAVLTHRAVGDNLVCAILDDAFMRLGEPEHVADLMMKPPLEVPTKIINVRDRFMQAMRGLSDAEAKRKMFRETFYRVLGETAREEKCRFLVQGTIRADVDETVGGVKTQHNVLVQMGINPIENFGFEVVEPLLTLYKGQVRSAARFLELPPELSERQPFPGPGLSVRVVGEILDDKLETVRRATSIVESELAKYRPTPSQFFAVIVDNEALAKEPEIDRIQGTTAQFLRIPYRKISVKIFRNRATGVRGGARRYGKIVGIRVQTPDSKVFPASIHSLISLQAKITTEDLDVTRVFYEIDEVSGEKPYVVGVRSVQTENFLEAQVSDFPWVILRDIAQRIIDACSNVGAVYYDITPKPPATIEME